MADKHQGATPAAVKDVDNPVDLAVKDVDNPVDDCEVPAKSTDTVLNIAPPLTAINALDPEQTKAFLNALGYM